MWRVVVHVELVLHCTRDRTQVWNTVVRVVLGWCMELESKLAGA